VYKKADLGADWLERHELLPYRVTWTASAPASDSAAAIFNSPVCGR
jgi:hypothetical protein